jgi:uncharacterized protein DUF1559
MQQLDSGGITMCFSISTNTRWSIMKYTCFAIGIVVLTMSVVALRWIHATGEEALEGVCGERLKRLALAVWQYSDAHGSMPPPYVAGPDGTAMYSWRVLVLPYLDGADFYSQFDFRQAWDSPHNLALVRDHPEIGEIFHCPSDSSPKDGITSYVAVVGTETLWPEGTTLSFDDLVEGANRILLVERKGTGILWTEPRDISYDEATGGLSPFASHRDQAHFVLPTGRVGTLQEHRIVFSLSKKDDVREWLTPHPASTERLSDSLRSDSRAVADP